MTTRSAPNRSANRRPIPRARGVAGTSSIGTTIVDGGGRPSEATAPPRPDSSPFMTRTRPSPSASAATWRRSGHRFPVGVLVITARSVSLPSRRRSIASPASSPSRTASTAAPRETSRRERDARQCAPEAADTNWSALAACSSSRARRGHAHLEQRQRHVVEFVAVPAEILRDPRPWRSKRTRRADDDSLIARGFGSSETFRRSTSNPRPASAWAMRSAIRSVWPSWVWNVNKIVMPRS